MSAYTPLEPITTVDTISTFDDWRVLTNQIISRVNNASSSNTSADYSELISRLVVRDENAAFVANNISGNNFTANVSYFFLANGEQTNTNTAVTASGFYAGEWDRATNTYGSSATSAVVDPITDPSGIRSMICRTTDAILIPRGTSGQAPINPEAGMLRFDTTMSTLTFWNDSTVSWKTLGGGELGDRDVDTVIKVEHAPGTDEDTIMMYVGNTGTAFPVFTINAATTNTTINAVFKDGAIYVTSYQDSNMDMLDDIIHELAHSVEAIFMDDVYGDDDIEIEFLAKRKRLYRILKNEGYVVDLDDFLDIRYNEEFDFYLYDEVGYNALDGFIQGYFPSPYSVTSLREYFATAFTDYFLYDRDKVKRICPAAYLKIKTLNESKS